MIHMIHMTEFYYHEPSDHLVYRTADKRMTLYAHGTRDLGDGLLACPASLYNIQILNVLGLPVVPPIPDDYTWPIKPPWRPRQHQLTMANFMVLNPKCFNLSDMGTMKTLST